MFLQNKNAVIYGAGGSLGGAVARAMAAAGATVYLTGRNIASLQAVADAIGKNAFVDEVDGFDEKAITAHLDKIGRVDISFNAVGIAVKQNVPLTDLTADEFVRPVTETLQTRFLTAIAAGKKMMQQRTGVILSLTATPGGIGYPFTGGFAAACTAVESFSTNLASELGIYGIRVVNIRSGGSPDSRVFKEALENDPDTLVPIVRKMEGDTMLKQMPLMADIANTAVFLASDWAAKITGVTIDVTAGTTAALNYRVHQ